MEMMNCPKCGAENSIKRQACFNCGTLLTPAPPGDISISDPELPPPTPPPSDNTSGQGRFAGIPPQIRGWNWGAFFFNWIWGVAHNMWESLVIWFVPVIGVTLAELTIRDPAALAAVRVIIFLVIVGLLALFGIKGSEWAWQHRRFEGGLEEFRAVQQAWARWGLVIFAGYAALALMGFLLLVVSDRNQPQPSNVIVQTLPSQSNAIEAIPSREDNTAPPPGHIDIAAPIPETAPSPQPSQTETAPRQESAAAPQPQTPTEAAWQQITSFSGDSTKNTPMFTVGPEWKIRWSTEATQNQYSNFSIYVFNANGEFVNLAANVRGTSADESYQYQAGAYYLTFNSSQPYTVEIWDKR